MMKVGDRVYFMRGKERCEGECVVEAINPETKQVILSRLPEGIQPNDIMVWEAELPFDDVKERLGIGRRA